MRVPSRALLRPFAVAVAIVVGGALLAGCSKGESEALPRPSKAFCKAAYTFDKKVERKASLAVQIGLVQTMADHAPKDIAKDTQMFLDALRRRADGDMSVVHDKNLNEKIKTAVNNVNRRAQNDCGLFEQDPPSGM